MLLWVDVQMLHRVPVKKIKKLYALRLSCFPILNKDRKRILKYFLFMLDTTIVTLQLSLTRQEEEVKKSVMTMIPDLDHGSFLEVRVQKI